jgi:hypothetical protein
LLVGIDAVADDIVASIDDDRVIEVSGREREFSYACFGAAQEMRYRRCVELRGAIAAR